MSPSVEYSSAVATARAVGPLGSKAYVAPAGCGAQWNQVSGDSMPRAGQLPRPPSLVFDIELEETGKGGAGCEDEQVGTKELKRWLLPGSTGECKLRNDVELGLGQQMASGQHTALECNQNLATFLTRLGYHVNIRTALGGGDGFECLRNLRHVFLTVLPPGAHATTNRFVVDLSFKEQFRIAKPSNRYEMLLACLPEHYVAPEANVAPLVNFLCQEMAMAFRATGVVLPPWRQVNSMLSKWLPRKSLDEQVPRSITGSALVQAMPGPMPRRSMDVGAMTVQGHWITAPLQPGQKTGQPPVSQQAQQARAKLQQADVGLGDAPLGTRRSTSNVKPLVCAPAMRLVGF